jgi:hypothetical protein
MLGRLCPFFPAPLIANLAKEAVQELSVNFLKAFNQILSDESTISRTARLVKGLGMVDLYVSLT